MFQYHRELVKLKSAEMKPLLAERMLDLVRNWAQFLERNVDEAHCYIPRWAHQGLNYLSLASEPEFTTLLTDQQFTVIVFFV